MEEFTKYVSRPSLDHLPVEILLEIFDHFEESEDLQSLALVCKSLHAITIPCYYRTVEFSVRLPDLLAEDLPKLRRVSKHIKNILITGFMPDTKRPANDWERKSRHGMFPRRRLERYGDPDIFNPTSPNSIISGGYHNSISSDKHWFPFARVLEYCMHQLQNMFWHMHARMPQCVLAALEEYRPSCRLHMSCFSLHSLYGSLEPSDEDYRLATSPSLHTIHATIVPSNGGKVDYNVEAIWDMIHGLAPNLKKVSLSATSYGDQLRAPLVRLQWPGLKAPDGFFRFIDPIPPSPSPPSPKQQPSRVRVMHGNIAKGGTLKNFLTRNIKSERLLRLIRLDFQLIYPNIRGERLSSRLEEEEDEDEEDEEVTPEPEPEPEPEVILKPAALKCFIAKYIKIGHLPCWYTRIDTSRLKTLELSHPVKTFELCHMVAHCNLESIEILTIHLLNFDPRDTNSRGYDPEYTEASVRLLAKMPSLQSLKIIGGLMRPVFNHVLNEHGRILRKFFYYKYMSFPVYYGQMFMTKKEKRCIKLWCPRLEEMKFKSVDWHKVNQHF